MKTIAMYGVSMLYIEVKYINRLSENYITGYLVSHNSSNDNVVMTFLHHKLFEIDVFFTTHF
jgi:hypothetical protein